VKISHAAEDFFSCSMIIIGEQNKHTFQEHLHRKSYIKLIFRLHFSSQLCWKKQNNFFILSNIHTQYKHIYANNLPFLKSKYHLGTVCVNWSVCFLKCTHHERHVSLQSHNKFLRTNTQDIVHQIVNCKTIIHFIYRHTCCMHV
jgi:hypothetical protein